MRVAGLGAPRAARVARFVIVLLGLTWFGASTAHADDLAYSGIDRATVRVLALGAVDTVEFEEEGTRFVLAAPMGGHGSGFVVHGAGLIVTAAHVVADARSVAVHAMGTMGPLPAKVVHLDEMRDVALLRVSHQFTDVAPLAAEGEVLKIRERAHAIGYPLDATRMDPQSSSGVVSGRLPDGRVQLSMSLNPGNSGGPVMNESEKVFGLVSARVETESGGAGLAVAVPLQAFRAQIVSEVESPHAFRPAATDQKLADLVSLLAHEGDRIVRGSLDPNSDEADRTNRQVRQLIKEMPKSPDAALLGAAFFWNRYVASQVHDQKSTAKAAHSNAVKLVRHAAKLDPALKKQSKFVRHVLAAKQGIQPGRTARRGASMADTSGEPSVAFTSPEDGVTLHVKLAEGTGTVGTYIVTSKLYGRVCSAPCESSLESGNYELALSKDGRNPVDVGEAVQIDGPVTIEGKYKDRRGVRIAGWVIMIGGGTLGTLWALQSEEKCESSTVGGEFCTPEYPNFAAGMAVMGVSVLAGTIMAFIPDAAEVTLTPGVATNTHRRTRVGFEKEDLQGLTLQARF